MRTKLKPAWPAEGFYRLTDDVQNPTPTTNQNWRSQDWDDRAIWPKGTLVEVIRYRDDPREEAAGHVEWPDGNLSFFGENREDKTLSQANEVIGRLLPACECVGSILRRAGRDPELLLAALVDTGLVDLYALKTLDVSIDEWDEDRTAEVCNTHGIRM